MERKLSSIQISVATRERLRSLGKMGDSYEAVILRLLEKLGGDC